MPEPVPEARLEKTELGLIPQGEGWFVLNARDASWIRSEERGQDTDFEGRQEWTDLGFRIQVLGPGQRGIYHGERGQENFLVVSGECLLVIEGEERRLQAWDFVHSPPWTRHTFVGAGDGPCVIVMAGSRAGGFEVVYAVNDVAAKYDASVHEETSNPDEAYALFGEEKRSAYENGWLPRAGAEVGVEENKALVRRLVDEGVSRRNLDVLDEVATGPFAAVARRWITPFRGAFPDFTMEIVSLVAEGDTVAAHFKCSGTHEGEWLGIPPTGRRFEGVDEMYIFEVRDGKLSSATGVEDNLTRIGQLGLAVGPAEGAAV